MAESEVASEVARELDLSILRYSKVWEDHRVLSEGLNISPDDDILCISRYEEATGIISV
jgi:hypothetical protein